LLLAVISFSYAFVQSETDYSDVYAAAHIAASNPDQAEELGAVHWLRDIDVAVAQSKEKNKPILILFQEVPGCSTCRNYGKGALSHPLLVEAKTQKSSNILGNPHGTILSFVLSMTVKKTSFRVSMAIIQNGD